MGNRWFAGTVQPAAAADSSAADQCLSAFDQI